MGKGTPKFGSGGSPGRWIGESGHGGTGARQPDNLNRPTPPRAGSGRAAVERDRWYPFAPGTTLTVTIGAEDGTTRSVGAWACSLRADHVLVITPGTVGTGATVSVPLETIRSGRVDHPGTVESSVRIAPGEHRTLVRFERRIELTDYPVCWGVVFGTDGTIHEITEQRVRRPARPAHEPPRDVARMERAANIITVANELARRAGEGAGDAELRELAALINVLLEEQGPQGQPGSDRAA